MNRQNRQRMSRSKDPIARLLAVSARIIAEFTAFRSIINNRARVSLLVAILPVRIERDDYAWSPEKRRLHTHTGTRTIGRPAGRIGGERSQTPADPINSNEDEDIPNLSAIYRE